MTIKELRAKLQQATQAYDSGKKEERSFDELSELGKKVKEARQLLDLELEVQESRKMEVKDEVAKLEKRDIKAEVEEAEEEYRSVFLKAVRGKSINANDEAVFEKLKELRAVPSAAPYIDSDVAENGGMLIPKSVSTQIHEYKREYEYQLEKLVDVQRVNVREGVVPFQKLADVTPWDNLSEWADIPEVAAPTFEQKSYKIQDYGGILPLPRRALQDTDSNLETIIAKHIARKSVITRNAKILAAITGLTSETKEIKNFDDLKDILNVMIDPVFSPTATILTNQDGFNFLDKLKDERGDYLVKQDVTSATGRSILGRTLSVVPNRELPTGKVDHRAPIIVGDLKEAVKFFDRGQYEILTTMIGGDSFKRNSVDTRVIDRFDVQAWDEGAVIAGSVDLTPTP